MGAGNYSVYTKFKAKDGVTPVFGSMTRGASTFQGRLNRLNYAAVGYGNSIYGAAQKVNALMTATVAFVAASAVKNTLQGYVGMASDLQETIGKTSEVFKENKSEVLNWATGSIKSMGLAEQTALDSASLFGDMGTGMGLSTKRAAEMSMRLTQLSADLSSFKNIEQDVAKNALSGVFTGETESLKKLGVIMIEAALQEYALAKGIQKRVSDMRQAEKVELRYQYVLEKTKNANGDFARTEMNFANQRRIWNEKLIQSQTNFGQTLLPFYTKVLFKLNSLYDKHSASAEAAFKQMFKSVESGIKAVKPIFDKFGESLFYLKEHLLPELVALSPHLKALFKDVLVPGTVLALEALNKLFVIIDKSYNFIKSNWIPILAVAAAAIEGIAIFKTLKFISDLKFQLFLMKDYTSTVALIMQGKFIPALKSLASGIWQSVTAIGTQTAALWTQVTAWWALNGAFALWSIGIVAATAAGAALGMLLYDKWKPFRKLIDTIALTMSKIFGYGGPGSVDLHTNPMSKKFQNLEFNDKLGKFIPKKGHENEYTLKNGYYIPAQPKTSANPPLVKDSLTPKTAAGGTGTVIIKSIIENNTDFRAFSELNLLDSHNMNLVPSPGY